MFLSVIVPVYNVRTTLSRCVQSILSQCSADIEVLLVDDGSMDGSGELADEWATRDGRIKVYHKANGGLSDARNYGLERASGNYVTFVDSDDELAPDTLPEVTEQIRMYPQADVVEYSAIIRHGHPQEYLLFLPNHLWSSTRDYWLQTEGWEHTYACNKVYRRSFLDNLRFPVGRLFEDMWFTPELLAKNPTVLTTSCGRYIYHWNNAGITACANGRALAQLLEGQMRAVRLMRVGIFSRNGWKLYRSMLFRQLDVYRLTGRILLRWPGIKLICILHQLCRS